MTENAEGKATGWRAHYEGTRVVEERKKRVAASKKAKKPAAKSKAAKQRASSKRCAEEHKGEQ